MKECIAVLCITICPGTGVIRETLSDQTYTTNFIIFRMEPLKVH